ncbi:MAG: hypothetical protein WBV73_01170 [Phormidium sp.]
MNKKYWSAHPLPRKSAKAVRKDGIGHLADDFGNSLPSVTTIIDITRSPAEKARLATWRINKGSEATEILQIGRMGHRHIERYFLDEKTPCPELIKFHWQSLLPELEKLNNIRLVEGNLFHFYKGYAGRVDCVGSFDYLPCAIEFKFSDRIKPIYEETKLQIAGYIGALNRQYGEPYQVRINHALIILATPEGADVTLMEPKEVNEYWEKWQEKVAAFWNIRKAA